MRNWEREEEIETERGRDLLISLSLSLYSFHGNGKRKWREKGKMKQQDGEEKVGVRGRMRRSFLRRCQRTHFLSLFKHNPFSLNFTLSVFFSPFAGFPSFSFSSCEREEEIGERIRNCREKKKLEREKRVTCVEILHSLMQTN